MITIPVVTERCAGIDVGKRGLAVAVAGEEHSYLLNNSGIAERQTEAGAGDPTAALKHF